MVTVSPGANPVLVIATGEPISPLPVLAVIAGVAMLVATGTLWGAAGKIGLAGTSVGTLVGVPAVTAGTTTTWFVLTGSDGLPGAPPPGRLVEVGATGTGVAVLVGATGTGVAVLVGLPAEPAHAPVIALLVATAAGSGDAQAFTT
jgi:hypothetical protein